MGLEFSRPQLLWLLPAYLLLVYLIDRRFCRRQRKLKRCVTLAVRIVLTCLCVLALAAPTLRLPGGSSAVWLIVDASDSLRASQMQMNGDIQAALANKDERLEAGVIAFGASAMVETPLSAAPQYTGVHTAVNAQDSCLSKALTLAGALLPSEGAGRIAVLSDGKTDDVGAAAKAFAQRGIAVDVLTYAAKTAADTQITSIHLPATAYAGQAFSVTVRVDSTLDTAGTLILYQNRMAVAVREVTVRKGENTFVFRDTAQESGIVTYEAQLIAEGDTCAQNDRMSAYVFVQGAPRMLLVEGRVGEGSEMSRMLTAANIGHEVLLPAALPMSAEGFRIYDAVILVNVAFDTASETQWQALSDAVRVLGRGLCVIGGDQSYALGGYRGTLLEKMLPVTIDVRSKVDLPSLALMLVIDKSGSMAEGTFGVSRLELAKEAAMRAAEVLTEQDTVGVIAFDDTAKWVVKPSKVTDTAAIQQKIGTIRPDGGTAFYSPLFEAISALRETETAQKHIIFLTDGQSADTGYEGLVDDMRAEGITLTTVAIGSGADGKLLARMAERGGGRTYVADEFTNLPKIFTKETYLVSGSYVQNRAFVPLIVNDSVLTRFSGFPPLTGYLAATEKSLATVDLCTDREDPLLAWWQYGAGCALCFMADSRGAWTQNWLQWSEAPAFYGGMAAYVLPQDTRNGEISAVRTGDHARITYTAPQNGTELETLAVVLAPDGTRTQYALTETAYGEYTGQIPVLQQGAYAMRVEQKTADGELLHSMEGGMIVSYAPEYDLRTQSEENRLLYLAEATGGRVLADAEELLTPPSANGYRRIELSQNLLWILLAVMVLDVALRRLSWDRAIEKYLQAHSKTDQTPADVQQPVRARTDKKTTDTAAAPPLDTAQRLLERKQNKKLL